MKTYYCTTYRTHDPEYKKFACAFIDRETAIKSASHPACCGFYIGEIAVHEYKSTGLLSGHWEIVERIKFNEKGEMI